MSDDRLKPLNQPDEIDPNDPLGSVERDSLAGGARRRRSASLLDAKRPDRRDGSHSGPSRVGPTESGQVWRQHRRRRSSLRR